MKFEYQDKIDSYVQGEMTAEERVAFELEVDSNEELRNQFEYTKQVKTLVSSRQEKLELLRQWEEERRAEEDAVASAQLRPTGTDCCPSPVSESSVLQPKSSNKRFIFWVSGIAAVLVLAIFVINPLFFVDSPTPSDGQLRGDDDVFIPNGSIMNDSFDNDTTDNDSIEDDSIFILEDEE